MAKLRLHVAGYSDSDIEERAELAWRLEHELRELDVDDVSRPSAAAPQGAKGSALDWAQLVVSFSGGLPVLLAAVQSWLGRHEGAAIALEIDGDRLELSDASASERAELMATWMARHGR